MPQRLTPSIVGLGVAVAMAGAIGAAATLRAAQGTTRTVFVSAVDKEGNPVTDMQATDFEVKENGKVQEITVKPATEPLHVAILVADWGTGNFQAGIAKFMDTLLGHADFSLVSLLPQPVKVLDFTSDPAALREGLGKVGQRGRQEGGQVLEGIRDTAKTIAAPGKRPVIVVLRIGSENVTSLSGDSVRDQLRKSGAILEVVSNGVRTGAMQSQGGGVGMSGEIAQAQTQDDEARQSAFALAQVLGDGSKEMGGRNEQVVSTTLVTMLENIANELLHQYEITYTLAPGVKPNEKLSVASKRKDVTVHAPSRLPK
jgi:VWFA-related protein